MSVGVTSVLPQLVLAFSDVLGVGLYMRCRRLEARRWQTRGTSLVLQGKRRVFLTATLVNFFGDSWRCK